MKSVWPGHRQNTRVQALHQVFAICRLLGSQATRHDDPSVLCKCLADGVQTLSHGIVDEAAGVDDHKICPCKTLGGRIALGAELSQDDFGICQCFGTAERNHADFRR